jgi:molybdopterin biosynthesis enzyme MoaB
LIITTGGTGFAQKDHTPEVRANTHASSVAAC